MRTRKTYTHANAEKDTAGDQLLPALGQRLANGREQGEDRCNEDDMSSAQQMIQRVTDPPSAA